MMQTISELLLDLSGATEVSLLVKTTILLALGLSAAALAKRARAAVRHLVLATTFGALLALPVVVLFGPGVSVELSIPSGGGAAAQTVVPAGPIIPAAAGEPAATRVETADRWSPPSWRAVLLSGWVAGTLLLLLRLLADLRQLRRLGRHGIPDLELVRAAGTVASQCGVGRHFEILRHEAVASPLTFGLVRPVVLMPAGGEMSEADLHRALRHELEHVRRSDWIVQLIARVVCSFYWFHPLVWVAARRLGLEAERAADDAVVSDGARVEYAEQLISLARRMSDRQLPHALGMAKRSDLSARVTALLDEHQRRGGAGIRAAASAACVAIFVVAILAPLRAVAETGAPEPAISISVQAGAREATALDGALFEAAVSGSLAEIERLLDAGANVNASIDGDGSPLIGAARAGRLDAVRLLLERGADPNMPVSGDGNPLIAAARAGHTDVVAFLLDRGAEIDRVVPYDENALIQASGEGHLDVVKLLVGRGADVNARVWAESAIDPPGEWRSPLGMARRGGHDAVVEFLRSAGARE